MCHTSVIAWAGSSITPDIVKGRTVIEVGSYNVNGSVRYGIELAGAESYLGVDISEGPGVDLVANVEDLPGLYPDGFGLVVSTEMLEHVEDWKAAVRALVLLVAPGGTLALSTRSPGFVFHPYPIDTWRYTPEAMRDILEAARLEVISCEPDQEQPGVFAIAQKPKAWKVRRGDWWPETQLPIWDGSVPENQ